MTDIASPETYRKNQTVETVLPSGMKFLLKRRLGYGDYVQLLNMLAKETGKSASLELLDEATKDERLLEKLIEFVVPRMCVSPKVYATPIVQGMEPGLDISELGFDDLMFINNNSMKIELSQEAREALESFRNRKPSD